MKKWVVWMLACIMTFSMFPQTVLAETLKTGDETSLDSSIDRSANENEEKNAGDDDATYHVWFDGTIGVQELLKNSDDSSTYHPGMSSYYEGATDTCVSVTDGKVTLPKTAGETTKYGYTLNGWYDVYNEKYYGKEMLGKEIEVTKDTVFYADWKASDYSLGKSGREKVTNQPNTSGFIETNVFDYNELFYNGPLNQDTFLKFYREHYRLF